MTFFLSLYLYLIYQQNKQAVYKPFKTIKQTRQYIDMKYQNKLNTSNLNSKKQTLFKPLFGCKNIGVLPVFTCKVIKNSQFRYIKQRDDNYNGIPYRTKNRFFEISPTKQKKLHY